MSGAVPRILDKHLDEVASLWSVMRDSLHSPELTSRELERRRRRLMTNLDAFRNAGDAATTVTEKRLATGKPEDFFAVIAALAVIGDAAAVERLTQLIANAAEPIQLTAIRHALSFILPEALVPRLAELYGNAAPPIACTAAEISAVHRRLRNLPSRLPEFLGHESPEVRASAWRIRGLMNAASG